MNGAFACLSALAWLLIAVPGFLIASQLGWPGPVRTKTALASAILAATALHVVTGRLTASQAAVMSSRMLALLVFAGTLLVFWLGVQFSAVMPSDRGTAAGARALARCQIEVLVTGIESAC